MNETKELIALVKERYPEVFSARRKRRMKKLLKLLLLEAAVAFLVVTSRDAAPLTALFLLLPPLFLKPWQYYKRSFSGRVVGKEFYVKRVRKGGAGVRVRTYVIDVPYVRFTVEDREGKLHHFEAPQRYEQIYEEGTELLFLSGLPYPLPLFPEGKTVCPLCGTVTPLENELCGGVCGLPLIRSLKG